MKKMLSEFKLPILVNKLKKSNGYKFYKFTVKLSTDFLHNLYTKHLNMKYH